jgi:hypothetical protein
MVILQQKVQPKKDTWSDYEGYDAGTQIATERLLRSLDFIDAVLVMLGIALLIYCIKTGLDIIDRFRR